MKQTRLRLLLFLPLLCALALAVSCHSNKQPPVRAFYYWKTTYNPGVYEDSQLSTLHCRRMYLRCFDADWSDEAHMPVPVSAIRLPAHMDTSLEYVPVFFITQKVMQQLTDSSIPLLAENINRLLTQICTGAHITPRELQADCDWTGTNKTLYFSLLKALKAQPFFKDKLLSCTIRLHQVKYMTRSGVPPADKGMLMCYNMGDLKKYGDHNSILDVDEAKKYLDDLNGYPLQLDVALPLFQWCLLFREQRFTGILRDVTPEMIRSDAGFEQVKNNLYRCREDANRYGYFFRRNDMIRLETSSYEEVMKMAVFLEDKMKRQPANVCLFHCDSLTISRYAPQQLEKIYAAFD